MYMTRPTLILFIFTILSQPCLIGFLGLAFLCELFILHNCIFCVYQFLFVCGFTFLDNLKFQFLFTTDCPSNINIVYEH